MTQRVRRIQWTVEEMRPGTEPHRYSVFIGPKEIIRNLRKEDADRIVVSVNHLEPVLEAAIEMFSTLLHRPGGILWPSDEELSRRMIGWNQRITKAKE